MASGQVNHLGDLQVHGEARQREGLLRGEALLAHEEVHRGPEAMLRLRAVYLSGDFAEYRDFHVREDQRRVYPHLWTVVEE